MIVKHIAMRSTRRSSFAGLAAYITSAHGKDERVGEVRATNVEHEGDIEGAVLEAMVTQARNQRSVIDKTYHLVVSFRPGEHPSPEAMQAIEAALCEGLGFGGHQRLSAVHHDTDNVHIHLAINKVHPRRHTVHDPFGAYRRIGELCESLEQLHGLEPDNHRAAKRGGENRADDMAEASGIEPLRDWIRRTCLDQLRAAPSWPALHAVAAENGLSIAQRGVGLVIVADGGIAVKPSTVARDLSRASLEARLGPFEPAAMQALAPARRYEKRPAPTGYDTTALFERYTRENHAARNRRGEAVAAARQRREAAVAAARRNNRAQRATIRLVGGAGRQISYSLASRAFRGALSTAKARFDDELATIGREGRPRTWADWLQSQAMQGDADALAALRARGRRHEAGRDGVTIAGPAVAAVEVAGARVDGVTKAGTIIFRSSGAGVRDDGARLSVSRGSDVAGIVAALRLARARYGDVLDVQGSATFREIVVQIAARELPELRFQNPALEARRASLARAEGYFQRQAAAARASAPAATERAEEAQPVLGQKRRGPRL